MDARHSLRLLRGLQNRSDPNNNDPSPANGTVAILIVLLALFCFLWYDTIDACLLARIVGIVFLSSFNVFDGDSHKYYASSFSILRTTYTHTYYSSRAPRNLRRCTGLQRSNNNNNHNNSINGVNGSLASGDALSPQEAEIAMVESSLRNMMASMSTMMETHHWGNSVNHMNTGDRREYITNLLMTKVIMHGL
jgi:hypothetical protein